MSAVALEGSEANSRERPSQVYRRQSGNGSVCERLLIKGTTGIGANENVRLKMLGVIALSDHTAALAALFLVRNTSFV